MGRIISQALLSISYFFIFVESNQDNIYHKLNTRRLGSSFLSTVYFSYRDTRIRWQIGSCHLPSGSSDYVRAQPQAGRALHQGYTVTTGDQEPSTMLPGNMFQSRKSSMKVALNLIAVCGPYNKSLLIDCKSKLSKFEYCGLLMQIKIPHTVLWN